MSHIRIISPSGAIDPSYIDAAAERLRAWGYIVSEGAHARDTWGRFAGTDEQRLADIVDALNDPEVDLILCARGGYGLQRIIDRVPPITKPVIGFSDITALHQAAALNNQPTLHAIMCKHIATLPEDSEPLLALRKALAGETLNYRWQGHPLNRFGKACAPIIGGNLSVLYGLQATPYSLPAAQSVSAAVCQRSGLYSVSSKDGLYQKPLLLIEDIAERHYHIDRMMRNLRMSGVLANISGLIVGQFSDCDDDPLMSQTVYQTIKEAVAEYDYPLIFDAPVGHVERNLPLWINGHTTIDCRPDGVLLTNSL